MARCPKPEGDVNELNNSATSEKENGDNRLKVSVQSLFSMCISLKAIRAPNLN